MKNADIAAFMRPINLRNIAANMIHNALIAIALFTVNCWGPSWHRDEIPYQQLAAPNPETGDRGHFKGEPNPESLFSAETFAGVKFEYKYSNQSKSGVYYARLTELKYSSFVDENRSWWTKRIADHELLKHEQGHFDIAELRARELNRNNAPLIAKLIGRALTADEAQAELVRKLTEHMTQENKTLTEGEQVRYDDETQHGRNRERQLKWEEELARRLEAEK